MQYTGKPMKDTTHIERIPPDDQMSIYDFDILTDEKAIGLIDFCAPVKLLDYLDAMINPKYTDIYSQVRKRVKECLEFTQARNPFHAGRPGKYDANDMNRVGSLKRQGRTFREIAAEIGCSPSTASRLYDKSFNVLK